MQRRVRVGIASSAPTRSTSSGINPARSTSDNPSISLSASIRQSYQPLSARLPPSPETPPPIPPPIPRSPCAAMTPSAAITPSTTVENCEHDMVPADVDPRVHSWHNRAVAPDGNSMLREPAAPWVCRDEDDRDFLSLHPGPRW
jgi:hypothetical protein